MRKILAMLISLTLICSMVPAFAEDATAGADKLTTDGYVYPMEGDTSLTWWVGDGFQLNEAYATATDSPFHTGLSEMTGVNIDWQFPTAGSDTNQAFNLMLASATLPDIIYFGKTLMDDAGRYMEEGVVRDLSENIQQYSPSYYAWLQSDPNYDKAMKTDDGKYYGYGFFREDGGWNDSYLGPVINKTWLDECGLEVPKTVSEFENVIKVFNEKYGAQFSFAWSRFNTTGISGAFGAYGSASYQLFIDGDGKLQLAQAQPEWLNYMLKLNEWWEAGLLDQDIFTLDDTAAKTKALNKNMGISVTSMGQMTNWRTEAEAAGNGADWVGIQYPTADDGSLCMVFGGSGIGTSVAVITEDCPDEKLETAMRLLDYAYTPNGNIYWNYGKEGVSWNYNADGEVEYTELVTADPDGLNNAISKYGGSTWSGCCVQATRLLYLKNSQSSIEANDIWYYPNIDVTSSWKMPSGITFTSEESDELAFYQTTISTFVSEQCAKFITGELTEADWESHLATLESMDLAKVLEINQAAYDRFLAR